MKTNLVFGVVTVMISAFAPLARGECPPPPVGGSEHSAGTTFYDALAASSFKQNIEIKAEESLVQRHGFCQASIVITERIPSHCNRRTLCSSSYSVKQKWSKGRQIVWLSGRATIQSFDDGRGPQAVFVNGDFPAERFGTSVTLDRSVSQALWVTLRQAGAEQLNPMVAGSGKLFASRVLCSAAVVPQPIPSCSLDLETRATDIDEAASDLIHSEFLRQRAFEGPDNVMGSVNTGLSLVKCSRGVFPGATAACSGLIETRPVTR